MSNQFRAGHVIDEYSVRANTIVCVCGWKGDADAEWKQHKIDTRNGPKVEREESAFQQMHRKKTPVASSK